MEPLDIPIKKLDKKAALTKLESFCAYQERSQQEARDKLYGYGLHKEDVENVICDLIAANFLNEERFAIAYTLGKFRIKHWGKIKIRQSLKFKGIGDNLIRKALSIIDPVEYELSLKSILEKKQAILTEKDKFKRQQKLLMYCISKGYERDLIFDCLNANDLLD